MADGDALQTLLAEPDFQALPLTEKHKVLLKAVPDYAALPTQERAKALNVIQYGPEGTQYEQERNPKNQPGFFRTAAGDVAGVVQGLGEMATGDPAKTAGRAAETVSKTMSDYAARKAEKRSPIYNLLSTGVEGTGLFDPSGMEEASNVGNKRAILGHAAVPAALATLPGMKDVPKELSERVIEPRNVRIGTEKVGAALKVPTSEEAIAASQGSKARTLGLDEARDLSIARDDLAEIERTRPVTTKGANGMYARAKNTFDYARDLWQQSHKKQIGRHAMMPMDPKSLIDVGEKVLTPEAVENNPTEARAARRWLQGIAKKRTMASMDELLRYINDDIDRPDAFDKYGNLGLQTKVAVAKQIREDIDNGLEAAGEIGVRDTNKRYAALQTVGARMIKEAIAEDVKGAREGKFPPWLHAYTFLHPSLESILSVGAGINPARMFHPSSSKMLAKGMTRLAKSDLAPPKIKTPAYVGKSPIALLPAPGETHTPMEAQAPGGPPPFKAPARPMPESASQTFPLARRPTHGFDPQAPGGPSTKVPPIEARAVPQTTALARRPGSTPVSHLPSSGRTMLGDPTTGAALPSRVAEVPGPPREVESHMAGLLRGGTISRGEIMRMQRIGVLPKGSAGRIFKLAGEKAP